MYFKVATVFARHLLVSVSVVNMYVYPNSIISPFESVIYGHSI